MITSDDLRRALSRHPVLETDPGSRMHAAVALVVRVAERGPEVLFIERAEHEQDPWSGHLGFPGGKIEPDDDGPRAAAERETLEELNLDLSAAELLGRLHDLEGAFLPVVISCFVYLVKDPPPLRLNEEVREAFWCPLSTLIDSDRGRTLEFRFRGEDLEHPAIQLLDDGRPLLWGITYRLTRRFLRAVGALEAAHPCQDDGPEPPEG